MSNSISNPMYKDNKMRVISGVSTVSFADAASKGGLPGAAYAIGTALDAFHATRSSVQNNSAHNDYMSTAGPGTARLMLKVNDQYYGGIVYGYRATSDGVVIYEFTAGTYRLIGLLFSAE